MAFRTSIIVVSIFMPILAAIFVGARFYAQSMLRKGIYADDWFVVLTLLITIGEGILTVYGVYEGGFGLAQFEMDPQTAMMFAKCLFAHQFFWTTAVSTIKISLILFYMRIFPMPKFKLASRILIGMIVAWCISFNMGVLFSTTPISSQWTQTGHYNIDYPNFLVIACVTDMTLDIIVLCLPLTVIRTLQISTRKKWYLVGIFGLGLFCIVASIARLVFIVDLAKTFGTPESVLSFTTVDIILWSVIEPCISIVTACLPLLGPLVKDVARSAPVRSASSFFMRRSANGGSRGEDSGSNWLKAPGNSKSGESHLAKRAWQPIDASRSGHTSNADYEMGGMRDQTKYGGIQVERTIMTETSHV